MGGLFLLGPVGTSRWSTYVAVGVAVLLAGILLLWFGQVATDPVASRAEVPLLLAAFLIVAGAISTAGGLVLRTWRLRHPWSELAANPAG